MAHTSGIRVARAGGEAVSDFVPHARRRDAKTDAIVRAALRVLETDGIDALTLQRVARELGIATTALYRYFASKDALLAALQREAVAEVHRALTARLAALEPQLARTPGPVAALARILAVARFYRGLPRTHRDAYRLVAVLLGDPRQLIADDHAATTAPSLLALLADVHGLLDAAAATGAFAAGDARARAVVLWATLHGLGQLAKLARLAPRALAESDVERVAIETLLRGFGADARLVRRAERALAPGGRRR